MTSVASVPREQYERMVALLDQAVAALDIATDALAAATEMPKRAVLTAKLATATRELRSAVGDAIGGRSCEHPDCSLPHHTDGFHVFDR